MILDAIQSGIFWLLLKLDAIIYTFVNWVYQIILILANGNILKDNTIVTELVHRLYAILGVIILFIVAYSLLKTMMNPDEALKGKESPVKIVSNVVISVILVAIIPNIFDFAMNFQKALLDQNTIGKLILGESYIDKDTNKKISSSDIINNGGFEMAETVFQAFFQPNTMKSENGSKGYCTGKDSIDKDSGCVPLMINGQTYKDWWVTNVTRQQTFFKIADLSGEVASEKINYTFIISTVAGVFVAFVMLSIAIEVAVRLVKLAVYQMIAPLPILARIVPKEDTKKIFSNWMKATISTYVEVFIYLAILFFGILIIKVVTTNFDDLILERSGANPIIWLIAQALVIIGIVKFIKDAPKILKDITGLDGGKFGKAFMRGAGMMVASLGGGATAVIRSVANDSDKPIPQRAWRALKAGASANARGLWNARNVEKFGDMPKAAGKSTSDAITARGKRETELEEVDGSYAKYFANKVDALKDNIETWAKGSTAAEDSRTSQAIKELTSLIDRMQDSWKKDPGYQKNKEEYNQAEGLFTAMLETEKKLLASGKSQKEATEELTKQFGISLDSAKDDAERKKAILKGTELMLQKSAGKSSQITSAVNEIQGIMTKYRDLDISSFSKLEGTSFALSDKEKIAVDSYGQLSTEVEYEKFLSDLRAGDANAINYLEALDKLGNSARRAQTDITRRETERKSKTEKEKK